MFPNSWFFAMLFVVFVVCSLAKPGYHHNSLRDAAMRAFNNGINVLNFEALGDDDHIHTPPPPIKKGHAFEQPNRQATSTKRRRVSNHQSREVAARQSFRCAACKGMLTSDWEIDHVIPLHRGGTHDLSNFAALHRRCHQMKNSLEQRKL